MSRAWGACAALLGGWLIYVAPAMAAEEADRHPDLTEGVLDNGLRYLILEAPQAAGVSMRLRVWVGSQAETRDERGVSHFIEHMAFRATRSRPQGDIDAVLAQRGLTSGRDHNAFTSQFDTTYHLDLPDKNEEALELGLAWLRDVGDGVLFRPEDVEAERGVVLAEWRGTITPETPTATAEADFHFVAEGDYDRRPAGAPDTLNRLDAPRLAAFHRRWYRPDNAVIVIVGPVSAGTMTAKIEAHFGSWRSVGAKPELALPKDLAPQVAPAVLALPLARTPRRSMVCKRAPRSEPATDDDLLQGVIDDILTRRLDEAADGEAGVHELSTFGAEFESSEILCILALHADGAGARALALAQSTLRSLTAAPPAQAEIDRALAVRRAYLRGARDSSVTASSADLADLLLALDYVGRPYRTVNAEMQRLNRFAESLRPEEVQAALAARWPDEAPPRLSIEDAQAPEPEALIAAWRAGQEAPLSARRESAAVTALLEPPLDLGPPGQVVRREDLQPEFVRFTFSNGVVLNYKRTTFSRGQVAVVVRVGDGRRALSEDQALAGGVGAAFLVDGGLAGISAAELDRRYATIDWRFDADLADDALVFDAPAFAGNLPVALGVMAAYLHAPGFSADLAARLTTYAARAADDARTNPLDAAHLALMADLWPDYAKVALSPEAVAALKVDDLKTALADDLARGRIEVTVVGDITEAAAREAVAESFGALGPRTATAPTRTTYRLMPQRAGQIVEAAHAGPPGLAAAQLRWPLFVDGYGPRDDAALAATLASLLEAEVIAITRQRLGMTYTPTVGLSLPKTGDQGFIFVGVESASGDLDAVVRGVREAAAGLARGDISATAYEAARRPIEADLEARLRDNGSWAWLLSGSSRHPQRLAAALGGAEALRRQTLDDIRAAAARWLTPEPFVALARPASAAPTPGAAP